MPPPRDLLGRRIDARRAKSLLRRQIGERGIERAIHAIISERRFQSQATDRQHDVGIEQSAIDVNRLARFVGRQVTEPVASFRIVNDDFDAAAFPFGKCLEKFVGRKIRVGLGLEHANIARFRSGVEQRLDQRFDKRRRLRQSFLDC